MCGRFSSLLTPELLVAVFGVTGPLVLARSYNIAPTQEVLTVRAAADGSRHAAMAKWGLVPHWAKSIAIGSRMINARAETVHERPAFRQALRTRRCIVPASGFFEWAGGAQGKIPHYVTMRDGAPLPLAGIWESWKSPDGQATETCSVLTTAANSLMATIHDRMPVILHPAEFDLWLDRTVNDPAELSRLFLPYPADLMQEWPVSTYVNNPTHNGAECIAPVA